VNQRESKSNRISIERDISSHSLRFKRSLNQVRVSRTLMQLFWTAGPVTGLGLIGGYYIGFGQFPDLNLLIYFISFTVLSGLIGLIARIFYNITRGHLEEQGERDVLDVTDKLGDLILAARDMNVQAYEGDARKREAALQLLRRVDLTSYGVTIAFSDLTGRREIGDIMGQIYTYRRIGLYSRVRELYARYREQIRQIEQELEDDAPEAAKELHDWFTGLTFGSSRFGIAREPHFLQRIMSSIENNNPRLMTFRDVEEMIILAYELISGREIPMLVFQYSGRWKYARALDELEQKRSEYRVYQARGGNRIRALSAFLIESGYATVEDLPEGLTIHQLIDHVTRMMDQLAGELRRSAMDPNTSKDELQRLVRIMKTGLELYSMAHRAYNETGRRHASMIEASRKWEEITSQAYGDPASLRLGSGRRGIRIKEDMIFLDDDERLEVCRHLAWYFERLDVHKTGFAFASANNETLFPDDLDHETGTYTSGAMAARRLAIEIALALEPHIKLSRPEVQRNINATKAIYLGELAPDMNAVRKAELGKRMAKDADNRLGYAAEQMAETLVRLYDVELGEDQRDFLHYTYGARTEVLELLDMREKMTEHPVSYLSERPPAVDPVKQEWIRAQRIARKRMADLNPQVSRNR